MTNNHISSVALASSQARSASSCSSEIRSSSASARARASIAYLSTASLHPVVGASDGKGRLAEPQAQGAPGWAGGVPRAPPATDAACEPSSPRASSSLRAGWGWLIRAAQRLDDHWIGDLIGALCLFGMLWIGLVAAMVFE